MKFSDIPSHDSVKDRLRQMVISDRIPHALLLEGPAGIGKYALARAFAQYIHCENPDPNGDACGECQSCRLHESMNHIDTHFVFPVVKLDGMNTAPISDDFITEWREYLSDNFYADVEAWTNTFTKKNARPVTYVTESSSLLHKLAFTSHISRYKIVIWWLPERMNEEAANKLLKMIEEPFEDTVFIMVSDNPRGILPTIYSRVQRIELKRLPDQIIADNLSRQFAVIPADAMAIAHIAEGNMLTAQKQLHRSKESEMFLDMFIRMMRLAYQRNIKDLRELTGEFSSLGRETQLRFFDYTLRLIRENFVYNFNVPQITYLNQSEAAFSSRFARFINERNVEKLLATFEKARTDIAANANAKIVSLDVAVKVILLLKS